MGIKMKKNFVKRVLAIALSTVMVLGGLTACGSGGNDGAGGGNAAENADGNNAAQENAAGTESGGAQQAQNAGAGGTIMWLSNLSSGIAYETTNAYLTAICDELGYNFTIVYGDMFNDAAGNLNAVKNAMTSDVVGLIASQDGGLLSIMEEYPELYVAGYNTSMDSVYDEGGVNAAVLENDHFLGTIVDGSADGADMARLFFDTVVEKGYRKIAVVNFPAYAYPNQAVADETFQGLVEEYNKTASEEEKIELVGNTTTLEFAPLEDSWFLEEGHGDLDCIVALCAGIQFVYPTMATAIANGTCSADTRMITGGFDTDESIIAAIGEDVTMTMVYFSPAEDPAYAMVLLDNAINGCQYADWTNERVDAYTYLIDSKEDIDNVMTKSMAGTADVSLAQLSVDDVVGKLCVRNNPDATYADLINALHDDATISVDALKNR